MIGSLIGDLAGSVYEFRGNKDPNVDLFPPEAELTDDSILTIATAEALLRKRTYGAMYRMYGQLFPQPMGGYGARFNGWIWADDPKPYNSWGNGSAMRVGPIGFALDDEEAVLREAALSASVTHDHPEGIKGAQVVALAIWLARKGAGKEELRAEISRRSGYDLDRSVGQVRATYSFNESCQGTVPEALIAVLDASDFEEAIRNAISLGGDADTLGCIAGGVAQAVFKEIPKPFIDEVYRRAPPLLLKTIEDFQKRWPG